MKKIWITILIISVIILMGCAVVAVVHQHNLDTEPVPRVGAIFNGSISDGAWTQVHYEGISAAVSELGAELCYRENICADECLQEIELLIKKNCTIIICNSEEHGDAVHRAAKKYPNIYFFNATKVSSDHNVISFSGRMYQIQYLCGMVAGMQTNSNKIGYVAPFPIPEVIRNLDAFTLGVRSVNSKAVVYVRWTGSWTDDDAAEEATEFLIREIKPDILAMQTDSTVPLMVADRHKVRSIGYNMSHQNDYPDSYLTASVWNFEGFYKKHISKCIFGKFREGDYWEDISTQTVSLARTSACVEHWQMDKVVRKMEQMTSGLFDVFYGPIVDKDGKIRVYPNENPSDQYLRNEIDWYVEGVIVYE